MLEMSKDIALKILKAKEEYDKKGLLTGVDIAKNIEELKKIGFYDKKIDYFGNLFIIRVCEYDYKILAYYNNKYLLFCNRDINFSLYDGRELLPLFKDKKEQDKEEIDFVAVKTFLEFGKKDFCRDKDLEKLIVISLGILKREKLSFSNKNQGKAIKFLHRKETQNYIDGLRDMFPLELTSLFINKATHIYFTGLYKKLCEDYLGEENLIKEFLEYLAFK